MQFGSYSVDLTQPRVMGVLNVTPDSFSDGGQHAQLDAALAHAQAMVAQGADFIDVGGESTRPGAAEVSEQEELDRTIPVIERLAAEIAVPISIDTQKPAVMLAAVAAGASLINDVAALRSEGALAAAAELQVPVCLMHMQGAPRTMQQAPHYEDVVAEVAAFLQERIDACVAAGIPREQILLDPGFGFGKTLAHNVTLMQGLAKLSALGCPLLIGVSRKSMIGALAGTVDQPIAVEQRLAGSLAAALSAVTHSAAIVRVHDVAETVQALRVWRGLQTNLEQ
ncbi:MAG: dihydropteroate synthase [Gammaproteobacteria bacterium]